MENKKEINLREQRDFGQKFNAVFTFVQQNLKPLFKCVLFMVGPLVLVGGIFYGIFYTKVMTASVMGSSLDEFSNLSNTLLSYLFLGAASLWLQIVVLTYMAEYLSGNRTITPATVWNRAKGKIGSVIGAAFVMGIMIMIGFILLLVPGVYLAIVLSLAIPVLIFEDKVVFDAIGRCFSLIQGKWWSTFGILSVIGIISGVASSIFTIPFIVMFVISLLMQTGELGVFFMILFSCVMYLGSYLISTLPVLAIGFQYFNLVERKESTGLLEKIDQIGKPAEKANEGEF